MQNGKGIWESTVSASQESWTNQINGIVRKKRKGGMTDAQIAKSMNVPVIRVKKLWFRYVNRTCTMVHAQYHEASTIIVFFQHLLVR